MSRSLDILVAADLHHQPGFGPVHRARSGHECLAAPLFIRKALQRLRHQGITPGLIVLLGDLVEDGDGPEAERLLREIAAEVTRSRIPCLAIPGNHDRDPARFARIFGSAPGLHEVGGYGFLCFHDPYAADDSVTRPAEEVALPEHAAAQRSGLPLVALQHNPLHPAISDAYPYMPRNVSDILAGYESAGVVLSLSGHYHAGQSHHRHGAVGYCTAPAGSESPLRFLHVRLDGRDARVTEHRLVMPVAGLGDVHCHTEDSYCAAGVTAAGDEAIARCLGLASVCLVDHTFQLYFSSDEAWSWRWQVDDALVTRAWSTGRGRMPRYRAAARARRSEYVRVGVEVDLRSNGSLLLADGDGEGWDVMLGAIHAVDGSTRAGATQAEAERLFMREVERMLRHPVNVLAHPFRFFRRQGLHRPAHLHRPVAELLAAAGVAAEINYHVNEEDPAFLRECMERGVRLALGTDSHDPAEVGELDPHLRVLRQAGVRDEDLASVLWRPSSVR